MTLLQGSNRKQFPIDDYIIDYENPLGKGNQGAVYRARRKVFRGQPDDVVAIKIMHPDENGMPPLDEAEIMAKLEPHCNIVSYLGSFYIDDKPCLAMELVAGGGKGENNLKHLLEGCGDGGSVKISETQIKSIITQILKAVAYLHGKRIIHGDIKPSNLLVTTTPEKEVLIKLCDFGHSSEFEPAKSGRGPTPSRSSCGTWPYMAPEIRLCLERPYPARPRYNEKADLYSVGLILYELFFGILPDYLTPKGEFRSSLLWEDDRLKGNLPLTTLLQAMLHEYSHRRASAKELLDHPFLSPKLISKTSSQLTSVLPDINRLGTIMTLEVGEGCLLKVSRRGTGLNAKMHLSMTDRGMLEEVRLAQWTPGRYELVACGFRAALSVPDRGEIRLLDLSRRGGDGMWLRPIAASNPTHLQISDSRLVFVEESGDMKKVLKAFRVEGPCIKRSYRRDGKDGRRLRVKKICIEDPLTSGPVEVAPLGDNRGHSCIDGEKFYLVEEGNVVTMITLQRTKRRTLQRRKKKIFALSDPHERITYIAAKGHFLWVVATSESSTVLYRQAMGSQSSAKKVLQTKRPFFGTTSIVIDKGLLVFQVDFKLWAFLLSEMGDIGDGKLVDSDNTSVINQRPFFVGKYLNWVAEMTDRRGDLRTVHIDDLMARKANLAVSQASFDLLLCNPD